MSTKRLNIDILAKDRSRQALKQVQGNLEETKKSVVNLKNALISLGVGAVLKSFVDVGKQAESLQIRFKFLFGSVEEGATALNNLTKFASKVPFSLAQISRASGNLAVVSKDANDLNRILEITGNVASVTGLDFETTATQIQRSFSGGIASADIFRERGVRALLGFKAGAIVTAEETAKRFEELFSGDGKFATATTDLAQTLEGTLSMIGDKYFSFQKKVSQEFFDELKGEFETLDQFFADNEQQIEVLAEAVGKTLASAITTLAEGVRFVNENFETFKKLGMTVAIYGLSKAFLGLAVSIGRASVAMISLNRKSFKSFIGLLAGAGFLIAETTGKLDEFFKMFEKPKTVEDLAVEVELLSNELRTLADSADPNFDKLQSEASQLKRELKQLQGNLDPTSIEFENLGYLIEEVNDALNDIPFQELELGFDKATEDVNNFEKALDALFRGLKNETDAFNFFKELENIGKGTFDKLQDSLTDFVLTGKLSFATLKEYIIRSMVEALVGQAIKSALTKATELFKLEAIREGLISVYKAGLKAYASVPPPFNIAVAGAVIAGGIGLVNKIKGFEKGGRPPVGQPSIVGEAGPELFVPDTAGTIVPNNKLGGATTVNVNIMANDTQGFDELLVKRRSVIVNVINDALNSQGKEALV
jgi:hypothetical protein